jgi:hypothetical protein
MSKAAWTWFVIALVVAQLAVAFYLDRTVAPAAGLVFMLATWPVLRFLNRTIGRGAANRR